MRSGPGQGAGAEQGQESPGQGRSHARGRSSGGVRREPTCKLAQSGLSEPRMGVQGAERGGAGRPAELGGHPVRGGAWDTAQPVPCEGESWLPTAEQGLAGLGRGDTRYRVRRHGRELVVFSREVDVNQKMAVG